MEMWLARDLDGAIYLYIGIAPYKRLDYPFWIRDEGTEKCLIEKELFPEVQWSDAEPTKVKLEIVKQ